MLLCCVAAGCALDATGESREDRLRRDRREQTETDREWRLKYETDWKEFLERNGKAYWRWAIAPKELRKEYQSDRRERGLPSLPFRHVHR